MSTDDTTASGSAALYGARTARETTARELERAGWPAVAEDIRAGLSAGQILQRLRDIGEQDGDAATIVTCGHERHCISTVNDRLATKSIEELVGETTARLAALHGRVSVEWAALECACDAWDDVEQAIRCTDCPTGELAGIHWLADPDGFDPPGGWSWVERCDACNRYPDDESPAQRLHELGHGTECRYFDRETLEERSSHAECPDLEGCSVAINALVPVGFQDPVVVDDAAFRPFPACPGEEER